MMVVQALIPPATFTCETLNSVFVCKASNPAALALVRRLQMMLLGAANQIARVDPIFPAMCAKVPPDGVIGPLTAITAQKVTTNLNRWFPAPKNLQRFLTPINEEEIVKLTGEAADELIGYIEYSLSTNPTALIEVPPSPEALRGNVASQIKDKLKTAAMIGVGVGAAGGLAFMGRKMSRRRRGLEDMADIIPEAETEDDVDDSDEKEPDSTKGIAGKA